MMKVENVQSKVDKNDLKTQDLVVILNWSFNHFKTSTLRSIKHSSVMNKLS